MIFMQWFTYKNMSWFSVKVPQDPPPCETLNCYGGVYHEFCRRGPRWAIVAAEISKWFDYITKNLGLRTRVKSFWRVECFGWRFVEGFLLSWGLTVLWIRASRLKSNDFLLRIVDSWLSCQMSNLLWQDRITELIDTVRGPFPVFGNYNK